MQCVVIAVRDDKAGKFKPAIAVPSVVEAMRGFAKGVTTQGTDLSEYPADFSLWQIGYFDCDSGELVNDKVHLANAVDFVASKEKING